MFLTWALRIKVLLKQQFLRRSELGKVSMVQQTPPLTDPQGMAQEEGNWGCLGRRQQQLWGTWEEVLRMEMGQKPGWDREFLTKNSFFPLRMTQRWQRAPGQLWDLQLWGFRVSLDSPEQTPAPG